MIFKFYYLYLIKIWQNFLINIFLIQIPIINKIDLIRTVRSIHLFMLSFSFTILIKVYIQNKRNWL